MGRPPKDPADLATEPVTAWLTVEERKRLDWLAVHLRERGAGAVIRRALAELYEKHVKGSSR